MTVRRIYGQYVLLTESNRLTALKTLTLRLRGAKTELEDMGEDVTGMATTTSQLQAKLLALTGNQVDIMANANTFKNSTQIIREMAAAWEDMNDIQRASALELMGGKRQANVLSALIQNFDTVESVIETSANSAGSALKENERYLDSIQGKIDQFTNATQSMWSNFLDADVVKSIVSLGTEVIKFIDKLGLFKSALLAIGAYKGIGLLFKTFKDSAPPIRIVWQYINELTIGFKGFTMAQMQANAATAAGHVANSQYSASLIKTNLIQWLTKKSTDALEAAKYQLWLAENGLAAGIATEADVQAAQAAVQAASVPGDYAKMTSLQLLGLGFKQLMVSIWGATKAVAAFLFTNPVGWAILAIGAIAGGIAIFSRFHKTTEELAEELDDFKSKLSDIRSELDSVNSELETTNERMAELLAKDKLTFEEQEELDRLRATNDELERRKELLEDEEESKAGLVGRQAAKVVESAKDDKDWWEQWWALGSGVSGAPLRALGVFDTESEEVEKNIEDYRQIKEKMDNASSLKKREKYQKKLDKEAEKIDEYLIILSEALDGVEYGDSEESDKALDYLAELQDNYGIARGSIGAKTNAIKGTFKKPEFESMSKAINYYVDALKIGDESAAESIADIINNNKDLVADLEARGVDAQAAIDYWTKLGSDVNFSTLEGKTEEIKKATEKLPEAFNNIGQFMDGDEVDKTAIADYFKGTSDKTREEIAKLIQDINDGKIDVDHALKKFDLFGVQSVIEIEITEVQTNFKDTFTDLENADGLIDTFQELADAIGSTSKAMDALNAAQAEMDYSGRVSIETALKLMESTDDYSKVLTVVDGKLVLNKDAEENLIEARIENMKASALKALEDAKAARETTILAKSNAEAALSTYNSAMETEVSAAVTASAWDKVLAAAAGLLAGIKSLFTDESWTEAYDRAYQEVLSSRGENRVVEVKSKYASAEEQAKKTQLEKDIEDADKAIEEQDKEIKKLQGNYDIVSTVNKDNIGDVFKSDDLKDPEEAAKKQLDEAMDRFQQEMDYWENRIAANQAKYEQLQNEIDLLEAKGQKAGKEYYDEQLNLIEERRKLLEGEDGTGGQKGAALAYLQELEAAGQEGSEEWWEVANTLNDIEGELDDVTASIVDLQDAIGEIDTYKFEEFNARLDNLTSKLETIRNLIAPDGEEDWFDDEGQWTEDGVAVLGTYLQELETYKQGYQKTIDELVKYKSPYVGNEEYYESLGIHSEQEYYDKTEELISQQYDFAESISDTKQSVVDMYESSIDAVEEYVDTLVDGYNDYIDSVKDALDAERKLFDFKKNVQKQAKDIAEIERRIASLSGSTNKADIAERRKLETQLYESRESLNDTYYDHAKDSQNEALDAEASAYEETMTKMVEGMRASLQEATTDMDTFLNNVTIAVSMNANTVLEKYKATNVYLDPALTNPWENAKTKVGEYGDKATDLMDVWKKDGYFAEFSSSAGANLSSPWSAGISAADEFKSSVDTAMDDVVTKIETNVQSAATKLSNLYQQIIDTENKAKDANVDIGNLDNDTPSAGHTYTGQPAVTDNPITATPPAPTRPAVPTRPTFKKVGDMWSGVGHTGVSIGKKSYDKALEIEGGDGIYYPFTNGNGYKGYIKKGEGYKVLSNGKMDIQSFKPLYQKYAKGTTGTPRDEWAITDESKFGDELVLVPGKDGNLSFMRKGTGVVPADMTQKLFELAQIPTSDLMNKNLTAIVPNITKNDFKNEFNFESLVHVDTVDSDTLPKLEKMVDKKIDDFSRALNYSLKKFAR